jgi:hypothetical protein
LLTVSRSFINVANSVLWRMAIILKANKVNLFVSSVLFVFWYHSPNVLDTPRIFQCMLERTDAIMIEVLEPVTFVLAYPTALASCSLTH